MGSDPLENATKFYYNRSLLMTFLTIWFRKKVKLCNRTLRHFFKNISESFIYWHCCSISILEIVITTIKWLNLGFWVQNTRWNLCVFKFVFQLNKYIFSFLLNKFFVAARKIARKETILLLFCTLATHTP